MTYGNVDERMLYLSGEIDENSMGELCRTLLCIIEKDNEIDAKEKNYKRKPIKLYINSYGGYLLDAWGLIDIIIGSPTPVYTYCTGYAMSGAFLIFIAGHKRFMNEHSVLMYHQSSVGIYGTHQDNTESMVEYEKRQNIMEEFVLKHSNFTKTQLKEIREKKLDYYIYPKDALRLGVVDQIIIN